MVGDFERLEDGGHHEDSSAQKCALTCSASLKFLSPMCNSETSVLCSGGWMGSVLHQFA
jgi:hypothetical protein